MKKIVTVLGARPQFVKAAVLSRLIGHEKKIKEFIIHTGQHYDANMSDIFFQEMEIPAPDVNLAVSESRHGAMTGKMLIAIEEILITEKPHAVLVYGDTNSTLAGALAAAKLHIPLIHIEAGMRSHDKRIPEEVNRILTDHISDIMFCTSEESAQQLRHEGVANDKIHIVGDVMYDAALFYKDKAKPSALLSQLPDKFYLATIHRQENTDNIDNLHAILDALKTLSRRYPVVLPLHPRTRKYIENNDINIDDIQAIPPVGYFDMLHLLQRAELVITDSGGIPREAYYLKRPSIIVRDKTEWVELVESGVAICTGANTKAILDAVAKLSSLSHFPPNLYGDGNAGKKILDILKEKILFQ